MIKERKVCEMSQEILRKTERFALAQMAKNDAAHDTGHIVRVVALTKQLLLAYPQADPFRTELLAWLHDLNDDKLASDLGTSLANSLQDLGIGEDDVAFILNALPYISYRKYPKLPENVALEIRIVQDADRIDAMGAVGIARTFAYGGAKGRSLGDSLQHFDEKLLLLYDLLSTQEAQRIALPRHQFLQSFYAQFQCETNPQK
jgi:uncharacterized protein